MNLADLLFPKKCLGCGKAGSYLCLTCLTKCKTRALKCPLCTKPSIDGFVHASCKRTYSLDRLLYFYAYTGAVKKAVKCLKYKFACELAEDLVNGFEEELKKDILQNKSQVVLVPVPLHHLRQNRRGYNQAEKLSRVIAHKFGYPINPLVIKTKSTKPQAEIDDKSTRSQNLRSVFTINSKLKQTLTKDRLYVVVDDVTTTGTTMREVAKVLKRNGAGEVWGLAVAG